MEMKRRCFASICCLVGLTISIRASAIPSFPRHQRKNNDSITTWRYSRGKGSRGNSPSTSNRDIRGRNPWLLSSPKNEWMRSLVLVSNLGHPVYQKWLLGASIGLYLQKVCRSEAVQRALYFWIHAGPVVAHYKFAKWWLTKTNAPLEKRDRVYQKLHNQYAGKTFEVALHLKGLYVKVSVAID